MTVTGTIWKEFRRSMFDFHDHLEGASISIKDEIRRHFTTGNIPALMQEIIENSPKFARDRAVPTIAKLMPYLTYEGVCYEIGRIYHENGVKVTF